MKNFYENAPPIKICGCSFMCAKKTIILLLILIGPVRKYCGRNLLGDATWEGAKCHVVNGDWMINPPSLTNNGVDAEKRNWRGSH